MLLLPGAIEETKLLSKSAIIDDDDGCLAGILLLCVLSVIQHTISASLTPRRTAAEAREVESGGLSVGGEWE